ncbi:glycosyltransferase family 4 protein [Rhizobium rhizophilum]|uniref:Glycosyltransferase family 4 protein n=1 Tax=Rhizobium rhizophilum TaxID=1850373 RepID=A0ABY2QQS5_9HYPH|nr:glycosyltransferase family 4 protein [Rhizobium rhizophilum]THV10204.1 glycosyltransferase family 4 protein [Rhizobium rhizophilum]
MGRIQFVWAAKLVPFLPRVSAMSSSHVDQQASGAKLRVFVHLAENKDVDRWKAGWADGSLVGVNDDTPYGYGRANALGCTVSFSKACHETVVGKMLRYGARLLLGFDFLHAWRQRKEFQTADVIWTHTESQYLAVAAVAKLTGNGTKIIGQTVWLFDHWSNLSLVKRRLYSALIKRVDVLTFHSHLNMQVAEALFPAADLRFVPFGIPSETKVLPRVLPQKPLRILAVGNDRHRDWKTLVDVVKRRPDLALTILSGSVPGRLVADIPNVDVRLAKSNLELKCAFAAANVVCVPLQENLHASGITAIEEAVLAGVPVIASDTGGLRHYFSDREIRYVPAGDQSALLDALIEILECPERACQMAIRAQGRMGRGGLGADEYILNHVRISRDILRTWQSSATAQATNRMV